MGMEQLPLVDGGGEVVGGGVVPPELPPQAAASSVATSAAIGTAMSGDASIRCGIPRIIRGAVRPISPLKSGRESWTIRVTQLQRRRPCRPTIRVPSGCRFRFPSCIDALGDQDWFPSRVLNLSDSGVLFGPTELPLGTSVEIILTPPIQSGWLGQGKQVCTAEVVRATEGGAVAARFRGRKCFES